MKNFLSVLFILFTITSFSQPQSIDSIPVDGVLLNNGWKVHEGDNKEWASPTFNDAQWASIDPANDIYNLPILWKNNIVWLRLSFSLDSTLNDHAFAFLLEQTGASEIYLNGELLKQSGSVNDGVHVVAAAPPKYEFIGAKNKPDGKYVLAVRFAVQKHLPYVIFAARPNTAFTLRLMDAKAITTDARDNTTYFEYIRTGIYVILTVLHLFLFCFYPSQKGNLFFFLFCFLFACLSSLNPTIYSSVELASTKMYCLIAVFSMFLASLFFFLTAIYKIFNYDIGIIYKLLFCLFILSFILFFTNYFHGYIGGLTFFPILIFLESMRIAILSLKEKKRGAKIIISGAAGFIVFFSLQWLTLFNILPAGPNSIFVNLAFFFSFLSLPVATSIFLALESTFAERTLQEKLKEVNILSAKTIAQEQEKQQILATQNETLEELVTQRTSELKHSLEELKTTQAQLIQSEKMASLGELTAGIAHEIQNPLNFVNNFSDVNTELIEELNIERLKPKVERNEELENEILNDIKENEQKINHHGKRAGDIVKGMLQHSRTSSGTKEPTDINALCDEYLRLSYNGLRAKNKDFNADFKTDFDESIEKINIVPQDIGRVILNLINNAFYSVSERKKAESLTQNVEGKVYQPTVSVSTKKVGDKVEIKVSDNGNGIPEKIIDKIFQPFFTTKPTGSGTGLGLSLSYDIIKAHNGEIKVASKENEGTIFTILLPA